MKTLASMAVAALLCFFSNTSQAQLTFIPVQPEVQAEQQIRLAVSDYLGSVVWGRPAKGKIIGEGDAVVYWAPQQAGTDVVSVVDEAGNFATLAISVLPAVARITPENAVWERFNSGEVLALALSPDGETLWVGTPQGLERRNAESGALVARYTQADGLPGARVQAVYQNAQGVIWVGTDQGLLRYDPVKGVSVELAGQSVTTLRPDGEGGLWAGTAAGLMRYNQSWQAEAGNAAVNALYPLGQAGWAAGTAQGLAYRVQAGPWQKVSAELVPHIPINAISGSYGLWWLATADGLVQAFLNDWRIFRAESGGLPDNQVLSVYAVGNSGVWAGTNNGLAYFDREKNTWALFTASAQGLPDNRITVLHPDVGDRLWIGTKAGLARLSFGAISSGLITGQRAAIVIAGGGADSDNSLWDTTDAITSNIYQTLGKRGFRNNEIYFLSPKSYADYNGDGLDDFVVDAPHPERPLQVSDIAAALNWAKQRGKLDQPLFLFFIDHGGPDKFQLSNSIYLEAPEFKAMLDEYQQASGNSLVLVLDACYSGAFAQKLANTQYQRAIVSSTGNSLAYFDRETHQGFSRFLMQGLAKGMSFKEAFEFAKQSQDTLLGDISRLLVGGSGTELSQQPQFDDTGDGIQNHLDGAWLNTVWLNGQFVTGDHTLAVSSAAQSATLSAGQPLDIRARITLADGDIARAWATIKPPRISMRLDRNGTPILAWPRVQVNPSAETEIWTTAWPDTAYQGRYEVTVYAEDQQGNIAHSEAFTVTVTDGMIPPAQPGVALKLTQNTDGSMQVVVIEQLGWGYDLYLALISPDGGFQTLESFNQFGPLNEPKPWTAARSPAQAMQTTAWDTRAWEKGRYCVAGVLSPAGEDVLTSSAQWIMNSQCFEVK